MVVFHSFNDCQKFVSSHTVISLRRTQAFAGIAYTDYSTFCTCKSTAPILSWDASVSKMNSPSSYGYISAVVKQCFSATQLGGHSNAMFFSARRCKGLVNLPKSLRNGL